MAETDSLKIGDLVTVVANYRNTRESWRAVMIHGKTYRVIGRSRIGDHPIIEGVVPIRFPTGAESASVREHSLELI